MFNNYVLTLEAFMLVFNSTTHVVEYIGELVSRLRFYPQELI